MADARECPARQPAGRRNRYNSDGRSPYGGCRMLHVALWEPEIPPNAGNIARLCAATGTTLHLIGRLGFRLDDRQLRRAGLDYWPNVDVRTYPTFDAFVNALAGARTFLL